MRSIQEQATEMLQRCEVVVLTSVNREGYPRPVPMSKIYAEGLTEIWMSTGSSSLKTKDFVVNPKAGLCFFEEGNSVALTGKVKIVTDRASKERFWQDWFIAHFPRGVDDPEYILLKFEGDGATYWIDGQFVHGTTEEERK